MAVRVLQLPGKRPRSAGYATHQEGAIDFGRPRASQAARTRRVASVAASTPPAPVLGAPDIHDPASTSQVPPPSTSMKIRDGMPSAVCSARTCRSKTEFEATVVDDRDTFCTSAICEGHGAPPSQLQACTAEPSPRQASLSNSSQASSALPGPPKDKDKRAVLRTTCSPKA